MIYYCKCNNNSVESHPCTAEPDRAARRDDEDDDFLEDFFDDDDLEYFSTSLSEDSDDVYLRKR